MKLHFRKLGQGRPLLILHGLLGQSDNWQTIGKQLAVAGFEVYLVDQRNHGYSPRSDEWNYNVMSDDLNELMKDQFIEKAVIIGHSMGGKTAMQFAIDHPEKIDRLIVVDIAPKYYPLHHQQILEGLLSLDLTQIKSRKEAEELLAQYIPDSGTRQFLLKNLYWSDERAHQLDWRFNLSVISKNIEHVGEATPMPPHVVKEKLEKLLVLFIRGEKSNYILDKDMELIKQLFPSAELKKISHAGHWIHAEQPALFLEVITEWLNKN